MKAHLMEATITKSRGLAEQENQKTEDEARKLIQNFPTEQKEHMSRILDYKCSAWLAVNPWEDEFFYMHADEFRDSIACRYGKSP
jgi:penicillin-binding protein-related factor A (putative recombinase)